MRIRCGGSNEAASGRDHAVASTAFGPSAWRRPGTPWCSRAVRRISSQRVAKSMPQPEAILGKRDKSCWDAQCRHRVELQNEEAFLAAIADWLCALVPPSLSSYILDNDNSNTFVASFTAH